MLMDWEHCLNRRRFLGWTAGIAAASLFSPVFAATDAPERRLFLYNPHTKEHLDRVYYSGGRYLVKVLLEANHFFRDHRSGQSAHMDLDLLDILHAVAQQIGVEPRYEVVSGYRSPRTNARLRRRMPGVAKRSYHLQGRAADVRLEGASIRDLGAASRQLAMGGVGTYLSSGFVHLDTGPVRSW